MQVACPCTCMYGIFTTGKDSNEVGVDTVTCIQNVQVTVLRQIGLNSEYDPRSLVWTVGNSHDDDDDGMMMMAGVGDGDIIDKDSVNVDSDGNHMDLG